MGQYSRGGFNPIEQEAAGVWTAMDYIVHVLSGRKTWRTTDGVTKAMESSAVMVFYRGFGLERLFRDVQAARYHPLPEAEQVKFSGEYLLRD